MQFLYPTYLFGLILVSIPIIIHLFNFQRARKVYFTNVALLKTIKEGKDARNLLKFFLILFCRILFIIFLIFTFAQPYFPKKENQISKKNNYISIYLDNSYSLENEANNRKLLDIGAAYIREITKFFKGQSNFQLIDNSFSTPSIFFYSKDRILEQLTQLTYSNIGRTLEEVQQKQFDFTGMDEISSQKHVFFISDFQKSTSGNLSQLTWDSLKHFYIVPLVPDSKNNLYIDSIWIEKPFIRPLENNICHVRIHNTGIKDIEDILVKLYIDEKQVSTNTLDFKANNSKDIALHFSVNSVGVKNCKISIEDYPISFDNHFYFKMTTTPDIHITLISKMQNSYLKSVYSNEEFFNVSVFTPNNIDYYELQNADLIVLDGLDEIDKTLLFALKNALREAVHIAVFPGLNSNASSYSQLIDISLKISNEKNSDKKYTISIPDEQNPFFEGIFDKLSPNINMPSVIPALTWLSAEKTLLRLKNNVPFLSSWDRENGKIWLFSSGLADEFGNFSRHALFVPVMYKIAIYAKKHSEKLYYNFSDKVASIELTNIKKSDFFKLTTKNIEFFPTQRIIGKSLFIDIPSSGLEAGNYAVKQVYNDSIYGHVAFNYSSEESQIDYYSTEELKNFFSSYSNVQIFNHIDSENFVKDNKTMSLWRYALILALIFLTAEILLIRFYKVKEI